VGRLSRLPMQDYITRFAPRYFVETGLGAGDGLHHALELRAFSKCWSIESSPEVALAGEERISAAFPMDAASWEILLAESEAGVAFAAEAIDKMGGTGRTIWWLDAHLPENYAGATGARLPLLDELQCIREHRKAWHRDVFLLDDWRLYEPGGYEAGPFVERDAHGNRLPGPPGARDALRIRVLLGEHHDCQISDGDEGYFVALPRI
jgi:hypothetical protein